MDYAKESLRLHSEWRGKLEVTPRAQVDSKEALSLAYTPGGSARSSAPHPSESPDRAVQRPAYKPMTDHPCWQPVQLQPLQFYPSTLCGVLMTLLRNPYPIPPA